MIRVTNKKTKSVVEFNYKDSIEEAGIAYDFIRQLDKDDYTVEFDILTKDVLDYFAIVIKGTINWNYYYFNGKYYAAYWDSKLKNKKTKEVRGWVVSEIKNPFDESDDGTITVFHKDWMKLKSIQKRNVWNSGLGKYVEVEIKAENVTPQYFTAKRISSNKINVDNQEITIDELWKTYYIKL